MAYHRINRAAVELLQRGGILLSCSCTGGVSREDFPMMLSGVAQKSRREIRVLEQRGAAPDHPGFRDLSGNRVPEMHDLRNSVIVTDIMSPTRQRGAFITGVLRNVMRHAGVEWIQARNPGFFMRQQRRPQVIPPSHLMLFTGDSSVGYWELPSSGVRLNGAKVEQDDGQLIRDACQGDTAAFGVLVRKYQARLCTSLTHVCGSLDDAEDVAQEAFVQAYVKFRTFAGGSAFYTWLYRIAVNAAISRRRKRREQTSVDTKRRRFWPGAVRRRRTGRRTAAPRGAGRSSAAGSWPAQRRAPQILVLREIDDCDYDEIAEILQLPVGTVRSRLHRARLQLKEQLDVILGDKYSSDKDIGENDDTRLTATWACLCSSGRNAVPARGLI